MLAKCYTTKSRTEVWSLKTDSCQTLGFPQADSLASASRMLMQQCTPVSLCSSESLNSLGRQLGQPSTHADLPIRVPHPPCLSILEFS